jgi:hypothetical protein
VPSEYDISLNIRNNRNYAQTFNGMGGSVNPLDTSNATTEYRYNITTFNFTDENSITIYYKSVGQSVFSSFTAELPSQNPEGLVIALNGLGIGFFNTYVELGQTFLGTYNENYIFGSLDVYNSSIPTTTTTSTSTTTTTIFVPTTTTTSTTSTTTSLAPTTSTTSTTTSLAPTTTSTTTTTTSLAPTTTSTTTTTTSLAPTTTTTTSTTTSTTTEAATTTSTTTSTTTEAATTTSTTTSTTTEAATTTSTTTSTTTEAATTTTTSTSTTTTTLEPTTTTTSTTTTTTTLAFSGSVGYSGNEGLVCFTPVATFTMTGNAGSFCASTIFTSASWGAVASGAYFIANGGNILPVNHVLGENTATTSGACTACPTTTTTTTTTTTSTTTTTTTLAFSGSVGYSGNEGLVCFTPVASFTMTGNAGSFCASTIFTSASWGAVASGAYFIAFGGNILPVNHVLGENTATTSGACTACPTTTTTTTTTSTSTTSTTSTTTTIPPVTLSLTPGCTGGPGTGTILANNFSGGTGSFEYISISATSGAEALTNLDNPATRTFINGATEYTFTTLANSTYYVAIMDFSGNKGVNNTNVLCTTTTTTSTTTTTTTLPGIAFGVSITTKYGTEFLACGGTVTGVRYQPPAFGNVPTDGAQLYTDSTLQTTWTPAEGSGLYLFQFGGSTKWAVFVGVTGLVGAVSACSGVTTTTTTTTSTTTTTTTLPGIAFGVSITTKYGTEFLACGGTVTGVRYQPPAFGNVPTDGAQLYTDSTLQTTWTPAEGSGLYLFQFGGSTKWAVFVGVTGLVGAVSACSGVTTTTTTTSTTTTTTTAAPVAYTIDNGANGNAYGACTGSVPTSVVYAEPGNTVPIVGLILYTNQNLTTPFVGSAGWRKLVSPSSVAYAAEVNSSGEITNYVTCTSQTTTTTSTTTSTTTLPGVAFGVSINTKYGTDFLACGGTVTGVRYQPPAFGNTPTTEAQLYTDSTLQTTWTPSAGAGLYLFQFGGSTKWAVFVDETGIVGAVTACSGVTTTTTSTTSTTSTFTTSTTSTTTTAAPVTYTIDNAATGSPFEACTGSTTTSFVYAAPGNTSPIVGLILYTNQNLTSPFVGSAGWRKLVQGGSSWAVVIDTNGEITDYATCASQTTTTTTTTSTTTTTTTSLAPFADVSITNGFFQGDITDVTVEGVTISGVSFPITIGNGATGTTTEIGLTQTIIIYYDNVLAGSRIEYTDGETGNFCDNISGGGSITWSAADVVDGGTITITAGDGSCP